MKISRDKKAQLNQAETAVFDHVQVLIKEGIGIEGIGIVGHFTTLELMKMWGISKVNLAGFQVLMIFNLAGLVLHWSIKDRNKWVQSSEGAECLVNPKEILEFLQNFVTETERVPKFLYFKNCDQLGTSEEFRNFLSVNNIKLLDNEKPSSYFVSNSANNIKLLGNKKQISYFVSHFDLVSSTVV
jgi:hypothetical protein